MVFLKKTWLLWLLTILYFANGFYFNNFYADLVQKRQRQTKENKGTLHLAVVEGSTVPNGFLTGAELAKEDIERNSGLDFQLQSIEPGHVSRGLSQDFLISAIVSDAPGELSSQLAVQCESYGVGLLLINVEAPFVTSEGFRYVNRVEPSYPDYCKAVVDNLGLVCQKADQEPLTVGLFFDRSAAGSDALVNTFLETARGHDGNFVVAQQIKDAVQTGLIEESDPLGSVDTTIFLQTGIIKNGPGLSNYLDNFRGADQDSLTVGEALAQHPALQHPVSTNFAQAYDPRKIDPIHLSVVVEENKSDCIVIISELTRARDLIASLRTLGVEVPVICIDYQPAGWFKSEFGQLTDNIFLVSCLDPGNDNPEMLAFRERFQQRAREMNRPVTEADEASVLSYESLMMLADVAEKQQTSVPIELMTFLLFGKEPWPGLSGKNVGFSSDGDGIGRDINLIKLQGDQYVSIGQGEL